MIKFTYSFPPHWISWSPTVLQHQSPVQVNPAHYDTLLIYSEAVAGFLNGQIASATTVAGTLTEFSFERLYFFSCCSLYIATDAGDGFITDSEFVNLHRCFCMFSCAVLGSCTVIFTDVSAKFVDLWRLITGQTSLRPALLRSPSLLTRPPLKKEIKSQVRLILQLLCFL